MLQHLARRGRAAFQAAVAGGGALLMTAGACGQGLDGFRLGEPLAAAVRSRATPPVAGDVNGEPARKWSLPGGAAVTVTAGRDTQAIEYIEHDAGGDATESRVGIAGLHFGQTLDEIRKLFGSNGFAFASNAVSIGNDSLVSVNCYQPAGSRDATLALVTSRPISDVDPSHPATGQGKLVAVILATTRYLGDIWGSDRMSDPHNRPVALGR